MDIDHMESKPKIMNIHFAEKNHKNVDISVFLNKIFV